MRAVPDGAWLGRAGAAEDAAGAAGDAAGPGAAGDAAGPGAAGPGEGGAVTCEAVTWRSSETRGVGSLGESSTGRRSPAAEGGTAGSGGTLDSGMP
ncbi:hypothetical protein [Galactobacter caseinivorans]|uniref:hypothetical protein n=1 Tax=Galactobacter caseinivorans TaxID=2676123 RepID=UPI0013141EC5|nr:hypothetical protein [Galactobacter caseinivorans]